MTERARLACERVAAGEAGPELLERERRELLSAGPAMELRLDAVRAAARAPVPRRAARRLAEAFAGRADNDPELAFRPSLASIDRAVEFFLVGLLDEAEKGAEVTLGPSIPARVAAARTRAERRGALVRVLPSAR